MTKTWKPSGEWAGATVAILGNGPSLQADLAALPPDCKVIAVSRAVAAYPTADMMVAIDGNPPPAEFKGMRVIGLPLEIPDALYVGISYEHVELKPGHIHEFRNNGMLAIRIAADMGARYIVLAGFDTDRYEQIHSFPGLTQAQGELLAEMRGRGIAVDFVQTSAPPAEVAGAKRTKRTTN